MQEKNINVPSSPVMSNLLLNVNRDIRRDKKVLKDVAMIVGVMVSLSS